LESTKPTDDRLPALDLLRFFAAVAVMIYHFTYSFSVAGGPPISSLEVATRHGYLGVELFFMISGFVILWSAKNRPAMKFARARALRLYPEFWVSVLISAAVFFLVPGGRGTNLSLGNVLLNFTMIPQYLGAPYVDGVYWTLGVEIKFYFLVWGLILLRQIQFVERWVFAWITVCLAATLVDVGGIIRSIIIFPYGIFFASGAVFFLVHDSGWTAKRIAALILCAALASHHAVLGMGGFVDPVHITPVSRTTTVVAVILMFVMFTTIVGRKLGMRHASEFATIGALTYPLYLLHNTGKEIFFVGVEGLPESARVTFAVGFSVLLAYAVYRFSARLVHPRLKQVLDWAGLK